MHMKESYHTCMAPAGSSLRFARTCWTISGEFYVYIMYVYFTYIYVECLMFTSYVHVLGVTPICMCFMDTLCMYI